jgi:DNA-binding transcriptional ArsR family regulator
VKLVPKRYLKAASRTAAPAHARKRDRPSRSLIARSDELSLIFKMLGNPQRLSILLFLAAQERKVSDIESTLKIRQPTLSQQLGELREAGLIIRRRVAKSVIYALTPTFGDLAVRLERALQGPSRMQSASVNARPGARKSLPAAMFAIVRAPTVASSDRNEPT